MKKIKTEQPPILNMALDLSNYVLNPHDCFGREWTLQDKLCTRFCSMFEVCGNIYNSTTVNKKEQKLETQTKQLDLQSIDLGPGLLTALKSRLETGITREKAKELILREIEAEQIQDEKALELIVENLLITFAKESNGLYFKK